MAAIEFRKQRRRWGSESTNFFGSSRSIDPGHGVPVPERVYRCEGSQYTNCGHLHVGTKIFNNFSRQDSPGTPSSYHLRADDQRLPKPLESTGIHQRQLKREASVDLYQSHAQAQPSYCMPSAATQGGGKGDQGPAHDEGVLKSLHKAFYTTTYDKEISRPTSGWSASRGCGSLTAHVLQRSQSARLDHPHPAHGGSGHGQTSRASLVSVTEPQRGTLPRRRAMSLNSNSSPSFPSRTEMIRDINLTYPSPQPPPISMWVGRPSSALTTNRIKGLRT